MRIFLTGAAGLIGGEVARRLVAQGHAVTAAIHRNPVLRDNGGQEVAPADRVTVAPAAFDAATLPPRERRLHGRVLEAYSSYFERYPLFDDRRFRALTGLACPPTDAAYLRRLIDHCIGAGFLGAAT